MQITGLRRTGSLNLRFAPRRPQNGGETKLYENAGLMPPVFMWDIQTPSKARLHPWNNSDGLQNAVFHLAKYRSAVTSVFVQCQVVLGSGSGSGEGEGGGEGQGEGEGSGEELKLPHDDLSIKTYPLPPVEPKSMVGVYLQVLY